MTADAFTTSADLLKALAHATRLAILHALAEGEKSVGEIEQASGIGQPGLSQQLAVLRNAELVETRRDAKLVFYAINRARLAHASALLDSLAGTVAVSGEEADVVQRLRRSGGAATFARME